VVDEVKREVVIRRVVAGKLSVTEAAPLLGLSERQVWRLKGRYVEEGTSALAHGNRGRVPANKIAGALREKIIRLARSRYAGVNDSHLAELLGEREHLEISRRSLQRVLRGAGLASPRRHRPPRYRSRRAREASAGALVLVDGSRHRWFGDDQPYSTCVAAIDDATSQVVGACFREQEDAAGYFTVLGQMLQTTGAPLALYSDRHGVFWRSARERESRQEELAGERLPTQFGRALGECGIQPIFANSPQAKGRIERLWGTWQDRLYQELRLGGVGDIDAANHFLAQYGRATTRASPSSRPPASRYGVHFPTADASTTSAASSTCAWSRPTTPCAWAARWCSCRRARRTGAGPRSASKRVSTSTGRGACTRRTAASSCAPQYPSAG